MAISNSGVGIRPGVCTSTTRPTAPYEGQTIYETDTDKVLVWNGTAWYPNWNLPWGLVTTTSGGTSSRGYVALTTATTNTAAAGIVDVTNATMTFVGIASRLYRVQIIGAAASTSSAGISQFHIADGSNNILLRQREEFASNGYGTVTLSLVFAQTGSGTIKMRMDSEVADTTVFGAVPAQGIMTIEDIGPA